MCRRKHGTTTRHCGFPSCQCRAERQAYSEFRVLLVRPALGVWGESVFTKARAAPRCPFNHDTGKGWVKGKQGEHHDALFNKNNRVEIAAVMRYEETVSRRQSRPPPCCRVTKACMCPFSDFARYVSFYPSPRAASARTCRPP
jgi:hypothetical protein